MKKLLFTFFGLILCSATCLWGAGTETVLKRGVVKYERTIADIATTNKWSSGVKYSFAINDDLSWTSSNDNGNYNGTGLRIYESRKTNPSTISVTNGLIDSISLDYVIATEKGATTYGILCTDATVSNPVPDAKQIIAKKTYKVNASSFSFYAGRTNSATDGNGRCDVTKFTVYYRKYPTSISLSDITVSKGKEFKLLPTSTPSDAYVTCTWSSDNNDVVSVTTDGIIKALKDGSATITATSANAKVATCVVTVASDGKSVVETFGGKIYNEDTKTENTIVGTIATWKYQKTKRTGDGTCALKSTSSYATWFRNATDAHIATTEAMEGGIKRVSFLWNKQSPNQRTANFNISAGSKSDNVYVTFGVDNGKNTRQETPDWAYSHDFEVKENVALSIYNNNDNCYVLIGDIVITPYLLFTSKTGSVNCKEKTSYDLNDVLINNTSGTAPVFQVTSSIGAGQVDANGILDLSNVAKTGDINITATWEGVSTTFTLTVTDAYDAAPSEVTLNVPTEMNATVGNQFQIIGTVAPATANPKIIWSSNSESVTVDQNGIIKVIGTDPATITATAVNGKSASCTINVAAVGDDESFTENFSAFGTISDFSNSVVKKNNLTNGISWMLRNAKRNGDDMIGSDQGIELQYRVGTDTKNYDKNYIVYQDNLQEGGVKRVAFQWRAVDATKDAYFDVDGTVGAEPIYSTKLAANAAFTEAQQYCRDLNMTKNYQFRIRISKLEASNIVFGPITITPYLLYKEKSVSATDGFYHHADLINNTGVTLSKSMISVNDETAAEVLDNGDIKSLKDNQTVTVTATWEGVTTTTTLTTHFVKPTANFAKPVETKNIGDANFTNTLTQTTGGEVSYVSTSTSVATVDANGEVTIKGGGSTIIKAIIADKAPYKADTVLYTLFVNYTPTGEYSTETFSNIGVYSSKTTTTILGDDGIKKWYLKNVKRVTDDEHYKIDGKYCPRVEYVGCIASKDTLEGGIKDVSFDWKVFDTKYKTHFRVIVDTLENAVENVFESAYGAIPDESKQVYAHAFDVKRNVKLYIQMDANHANAPYNDRQQVFPIIGNVRITPYLLYTTKEAEATATYKNIGLINNTPKDDEIEYTLEDNDDEAIIGEDGTVTALKEGEVTVKATWKANPDVYTTYKLKLHLGAPNVKFTDAVVKSQAGAASFTIAPTFTTPGTATYRSTNEYVAKVDDKSGTVSDLYGGTTQITADIASTGGYRDTTVFYTLDVSYSPAENTYYEEKFDSITSGGGDGPYPVVGNNGMYNWSISKFQRSTTDDKVGDAQGIRLRYDATRQGYIETTGTPEGGLKELAFDYCSTGGTSHPIQFNVKVGDDTIDCSRVCPVSQSNIFTFAYPFNNKTGYDQLKIYMDKSATTVRGYLIVGPLKIVPYLLYKSKRAEASEKDGAYTHPIFDNTDDHAIEYSIVEDNGVASIDDPTTGAVRILKEGEVTVKATWKTHPEVFTTYILKTHMKPIPVISFETASLTKDLYDADFTNTFTTPAGVGDTTYTSSNEEVATVDATGKVKILSAGATTIMASVAENDAFAANSVSYDLKVGFTATEQCWKETFSKCTSVGGDGSDVSAEVDGDDGTVKKWQLIKFQRREKTDAVGKEQGIQVRYSGSIANKVDLEGGIKNVYFNWKPTNQVNVNHFWVNVNGTDYVCNNPIISDKDSILLYARKFDAATNISSLSIKMDSKHNPQQSYPIFGALKITPYLLYTKKDTTIKAIDYVGEGVFVNNDFINNTGVVLTAEQEDIEFTISGDENVATINKKGELTILNGGDVTIQAKWGNVTTTYNLHITKETTTVTLEGAEIDAFGTYTPAPVAKIGENKIDTAKFTYNSTNKDVVDVVGNKLVFKRVGETKITATLVEGATYQSSTSDEATLTINEPTGNDCWKETFSKFEEVKEYNSSSTKTTIQGDSGVIEWQVKHYRHNFTEDKVNNEQGILLKKAGELKANQVYLAYNGTGEETGGVKAYFFNGRVLNDGPRTAHVNVQLSSGSIDTTHTFTNVPTGEFFSCANTINCKKDGMLRIGFKNNDSIVVGPVTIVPYLLYTKRDTIINIAEYLADPEKRFENDAIINNTGAELSSADITFSIKDETAETQKIATVDANGKVTVKSPGTVTVKAAWQGVSTTYTLHIEKAEFTPTFAESTVEKTMNDSSFNNTLNNVPEKSTGDRTYSSTVERVATVNSDGKVTIYGPGETKIKVVIAADGIYEETSAEYTLTVSEPTTDTDVTEGFTGLHWDLNVSGTLNGDLGAWTTYYTRRNNDIDSIISKDKKVGAEWMSGEKQGYLVSNEAMDGGVKRIYLTWVKTEPKAGQESKFLVQVGEVKDTFDCKEITNGIYLHNFNIRENSVIKVANASANNFRAGPIVITPYICYLNRIDTVIASECVYPKVYAQALMDNTNGVGKITYHSDNTDVAEALTNGTVKVKHASDIPVTITAKWQPDENEEKYVTASIKLYVVNKKIREAAFAQPSVTVARGETPDNALDLQSPPGDTQPKVVYESSDTEVAIIDSDSTTVITVGPGTATITAHIGETNKCLPQDVSYTLNVTYSPTDAYFTETFPGTSESAKTGYVTGPDTITGVDGLYTWGLKRYQRKPVDDKVKGEQGVRICYNGKTINAYLATIGEQEGGLKEVVFDYCVPGNSFPIHFLVQVGDSIHDFHHEAIYSANTPSPYAHTFNKKSNTNLSIIVNEQEDPQQAAIIVSPVKIIPYLLYTRKDTTIHAKDLAAQNFKFFNDKWINNIDEGTVSYSVKAKDNAVEIDGDSVKILKEGTDTIQASWESVTTTYVIHTILEEDANLQFAKAKDTVLLETLTYQQEATTDSPAKIKYEFVGEHGDAGIDDESGLVTFNGQTGTFTIRASVPVGLPYNVDTATYELVVNEKKTPTVIFNDTTVDMNYAPFNRPAASIPSSGMGQAHYTSSDKAVATVGATSGMITITGQGQTTISVHFDMGDEYMPADASFKVTVTDPMEAKISENFRDTTFDKKTTKDTLCGSIPNVKWEFQNIRRLYEDTYPDTLIHTCDNIYATRLQNATNAHIITTEPFEGGIKRVSFLWNRNSPGKRTSNFIMAAGDTKDTIDITVDTINEVRQLPKNYVYNHNFGVKENVKFSIYNNNTNCYVLIGDINITPYLRFKGEKVMNIDLDKVSAFNLNDTIYNNTEGGTITFAVDSFKTDVAPDIIDSVVDFSKIVKGGKVYISATWAENPGVKTTLVINTTIKPQISFAVPAPAAQNLIDGSYTNVLSAPEGVGAVTYTSSNKQVATVDINSGVVTFLIAGTTTITAKVAASDIYNKTEKSYDLTINGYTPVEGKSWTETFRSFAVETSKSYIASADVVGDSSVYNWKVLSYHRQIGDTILKEYGTRINENGSISSVNMEGGIKYLAFNWRPKNTQNAIDFTVKVGENEYHYSSAKSSAKSIRYERFVNAKQNANLTLKLHDWADGKAYVVFGNITVVPYLLYTEKEHTLNVALGVKKYTNTNIINNLEDADKANVVYSYVDAAGIVKNFNTATGEVEVNDNVTGDITIKAALGDDLYTTYTLHVTNSITLDEEKDNSSLIEQFKDITLDVTLNRKLFAGKYNTFCVPFAIGKTDLQKALKTDITQLITLDESQLGALEEEGGQMNLNIAMKEVETIEAGKPYLIEVAADVTQPINISGVTIKDVGDDNKFQSTDKKVTFYGITSKYLIANDNHYLFMSNNRLSWNNSGAAAWMKGLRSYFHATDGGSGVAARLVFNQPTTPTGMNQFTDSPVHRFTKIIKDNQLIIIRDGKMFNAQGALVK